MCNRFAQREEVCTYTLLRNVHLPGGQSLIPKLAENG